MDEIDIMSLILVTVAAVILCVAVISWMRLPAEQKSRGRSDILGHGIDVSAITPQIRQVRQDYVATRHTVPRPASSKAALVAASRRIIAGLPFFHAANSELEKPLDEI
jgi:hypothetical protein